MSSGRDTDTSRVGQVVPSDRSKTGEQNNAREAVAAWQSEDVSRFCWYFAPGELEGRAVCDSCVTFVNGCGKGGACSGLTFREASRMLRAPRFIVVLAGGPGNGTRPIKAPVTRMAIFGRIFLILKTNRYHD